MAGLDGVMTVMKLEPLDHQWKNNSTLDEGYEKEGGNTRSSGVSNPTPESTATVVTKDSAGLLRVNKTEARIPKYRPIQAKKLGPIVSLTSGKMFQGSKKNQVLACTVDGWLHIFDLPNNMEFEGPRSIDEVAPMFTIAIPHNVSEVRVLDSVMVVGAPSPIIVLVTNEIDKGPSTIGLMHFLYLQFKEIDAETNSSVPPCLIPAMNYSMGGEITSLVINPYPLSPFIPEGQRGGHDFGKTTSSVWTIAVGFEGGGIAVLSVRSSVPSAGEDVGKLEIKPVPMKIGGGLPLSTWGWNGFAFVFGPFKRGEGFGVCTVDGRVAYIEVKNCNNNELPQSNSRDNNDEEEECCQAEVGGEMAMAAAAAGPSWSTRWYHQTRETFFYGGALPLGSSTTTMLQTLSHINQRQDMTNNDTIRNVSDVEPFAVCSWGGITMICDAEGMTSPIYFDPRGFIDSPLRAFTCGLITPSGRTGSHPALIYATGGGEIIIYHSLWDEIGHLHSVVPSFEERILRGGGIQKLQLLLTTAWDRLGEYEKLELSQPKWEEDGGLAKSTSPLPHTWKDLASLSRFLFERGTSTEIMDLRSGPPFVSAMRESITPILNEIKSSNEDGHDPSLSCKPNLQRLLNRLALATRAEKLNI